MPEVFGTLGGITEKPSGWFEISVVMEGKQYPLRLDTKKQELVELARAAGTEFMEWSYTEKESDKINEHTGKPYVNRYFEGVVPARLDDLHIQQNATVSPSSAPQDESKSMTKEEWARKDSAIHKMACIKTAAAALTHTVPADPSTEDLNKFSARVTHLALGWHRSVLAERDDPAGEEVPF